jgi:hypothetical protein
MGKLGSSMDMRAEGDGRERRRRARRVAAGLLPVALGVVAAGCSGSGGGEGPGDDAAAVGSTATTAPPPVSCAESRHVVVFDFFGFLSLSDEDLAQWADDPTDAPDVRPGTPELASAYRSLGYELAYVTTVPVNFSIGDVPIDDAVRDWLAQRGFPGGEGTTILTWESGDPIIGITNQLLRFAGQDVNVAAGYTDNEDKAYAIITGGVPAGRMFTIDSGAGTQGSRAIPDDDVQAHALNVQELPEVCDTAAAATA